MASFLGGRFQKAAQAESIWEASATASSLLSTYSACHAPPPPSIAYFVLLRCLFTTSIGFCQHAPNLYLRHLYLCLSNWLETGKVMTEYVYPEWFGMASTEEDKAEFKKWMEPVTHVYSKGMATPVEGAVSKASTSIVFVPVLALVLVLLVLVIPVPCCTCWRDALVFFVWEVLAVCPCNAVSETVLLCHPSRSLEKRKQ